jgi:hypothetical protein
MAARQANYIRIPNRICAEILCSEAALGLYHKNTVNVSGCVHRTLKLKLNNNDGGQCGVMNIDSSRLQTDGIPGHGRRHLDAGLVIINRRLILSRQKYSMLHIIQQCRSFMSTVVCWFRRAGMKPDPNAWLSCACEGRSSILSVRILLTLSLHARGTCRLCVHWFSAGPRTPSVALGLEGSEHCNLVHYRMAFHSQSELRCKCCHMGRKCGHRPPHLV